MIRWSHIHSPSIPPKSSYNSYNFYPRHIRMSQIHGLPTPSNSSYNSYNFYSPYIRRSQTHDLPTPSIASFNSYNLVDFIHVTYRHTEQSRHLKFLLQILQFLRSCICCSNTQTHTHTHTHKHTHTHTAAPPPEISYNFYNFTDVIYVIYNLNQDKGPL